MKRVNDKSSIETSLFHIGWKPVGTLPEPNSFPIYTKQNRFYQSHLTYGTTKS